MNAARLEELAAEVRHRAGLKPLDMVASTRIAVQLLGTENVRVICDLATTACIFPSKGSYRIFVRAGIPEPHFVVGHELGHWAMMIRQLAFPLRREERYADRIGRGIVMPPALVTSFVARYGANVELLAIRFRVLQATARRRLVELGIAVEAPRALTKAEKRSALRVTWKHPPAGQVAA